jgi:rare lipoprotein A
MNHCSVMLAFLLISLPLTAKERDFETQTGMASWYGAESSRKTATGQHYNPAALTAAHRTLPIGTLIQVRNLSTGGCVTVRVTDRGPFCKGRIIDVSKAAAEQLKMIHSGTAKVQIEVVK